MAVSLALALSITACVFALPAFFVSVYILVKYLAEPRTPQAVSVWTPAAGEANAQEIAGGGAPLEPMVDLSGAPDFYDEED